MTKKNAYEQGWDSKIISDIAKRKFGGDYTKMFSYHGWPERGQAMMGKVQTRVVETYGSVQAFENNLKEKPSDVVDQSQTENSQQVHERACSFWPDDIDVLLTSFWGWSPETWGNIGFTHEGRRSKLLAKLSDPFITVCYVTTNKSFIDPDLKGMIAGFYLVSHEVGDRDKFSDVIHHADNPEKWRHSLRAIRAFSYLPEYRISINEFDPSISEGGKARSVAANGMLVESRDQIRRLQNIPYQEVQVYSPSENTLFISEKNELNRGFVRPGPANHNSYVVAGGTDALPRELYILHLMGDTSAFLGHSADGRMIVKVGLSASPELRRQAHQKHLPEGAFSWAIVHSTRSDGDSLYDDYIVAVEGESAMKRYLSTHADWLGGEFYLASEEVILEAWRLGKEAAKLKKAMRNDQH